MIPYEWLQQAAERIIPYIHVTPLLYDPKLNIYLKLENRQVTGSFKARGALNRVLTLQSWEVQAGLVTASAGNHGQGVALAAQKVGAQAIIFASDHAVESKIAAMRALGAQVRLVSGGYGDAERAGLAFARSSGATWISPYNDPQVVAGQGTLGLELGQQLPPGFSGIIVVPAGGGGLLSGVGLALESSHPQVKVIAVQAQASPFLHALYTKGTQEDILDLPTLADGLSGEVEPQSLTIPLMRTLVDEFYLVGEAEIAYAIAYAWYHYNEKIEGSAAVTLAAILSGAITTRPAVLVLSGGNIQPEEHAQIIRQHYDHFEKEIG